MEIKCFSCKHFRQFYVKCSTRFRPLPNGFCLSDNATAKRSHKKFRLLEECEFWELNEEDKEKNERQIAQVIKDAEKHLNEIAMILRMNN